MLQENVTEKVNDTNAFIDCKLFVVNYLVILFNLLQANT